MKQRTILKRRIQTRQRTTIITVTTPVEIKRRPVRNKLLTVENCIVVRCGVKSECPVVEGGKMT